MAGVPAPSRFSAFLCLLLLSLIVAPSLQAGVSLVYTGAARTTVPAVAGLSLTTALNDVWPSQSSFIFVWRNSANNMNAYGYSDTNTFIRYPSVNVLSQNLLADSKQLYITFWESAQRIVVCLANGFFTMSAQLTDTRTVSRFATSETNDHIASCAVDQDRGVLWLELRLNGTEMEINLEAWNLTSMTPTDDPLIWANATLCPEPANAQKSNFINNRLIINCFAAGQGYVDFSVPDPAFTQKVPLGITSISSATHRATGNPWYLLSVIGIQEWDFSSDTPRFSSVSQAMVADSSVLSMKINEASGTLYWVQNALLPPTSNGPVKITQLGTSSTVFQSSLGNSIQFNVGGRGARGFGVDGTRNRLLVLIETQTIGVYQVDVNLYSFGNCPTVSSCGDCVAAADAECGWCLDGTSSGGSCIRAQQCTTPRWFQETCPSLTAVDPASPLVTGMPFLIQLTTSLFRDFNVSCALRSSSQLIPLSIIPAAAPICGISSSTSPVLSTLAGSYNLEVVLDGYFQYPSPQTVNFVNCSSFSTCGSCTAASTSCDWCVYDGQCVNTGTSCSTAGPASQRPTIPSQCPVQGPSSPLASFVPVPSGNTITIPATSLITSTTAALYRCVFTLEDSSQIFSEGSYRALPGSSGVVCNIPSPAPGYVGHANVSLYFNQHPFADNVETFTYYDCTASSFSTCDLCLASSNALCGWNTATSSCTLASSCTAGSDCRSSCPALTSLSLSSYHHTLDVGTTVTVTGSFFTAASPSAWQCNFGVATTTATRVSATQLTCPVPAWTDGAYFTSTRTIYTGFLSVMHSGNVYASPLPINWYSCGGTNCSSCLNGAKAPKCNWDPSAYSCGTQTSALSACPVIESMSDTYAHVGGSLSLDITAAVAPGALNYRCAWTSFSGASSTNPPDLNAPATLSGRTWSCSTPDITAYTSDSVTAWFLIEVETTSAEWKPFTAEPVAFNFYDCALRTTCNDCLLSSQCYWVNYTSCTNSLVSGDEDPMHGECPKLITTFPRIQPVLVQQNVILEVNYLPTSDMSDYKCQFALPSGGNPIVSQVSLINSSHVSCPFKRTYHDLNNAILQLSIVKGSITPRKIVTSNSVPYEVYNCAASSTCSECSSSHPLCGWCPDLGSCTDQSTCAASSAIPWTREDCPYLNSYMPPYASLGRLTKITFTGQFFGAEHVQLKCRYNGVDIAEPVSFSTTEVVCQLPSVSSSQTVTIELVQQTGVRRAPTYSLFVPDLISFDFFSCLADGMNATDCGSCSGAGNDPRCGWCAYDAFCGDQYACHPSYSAHFALASNCPQIDSLDPFEGPLKGNTEVTVTGSLFFQGVDGTACSFGSQVVPANVISSTSLTCISPPASSLGIKKGGTSVDLKILWNGAVFTRDSSFRFTYKNTDKTTTIAIATVFSVLAFIIILIVILFAIFWKKMVEKRDRTKFLKLREPDYPKVAFSQTKGIDVLLTPGELKQLAKFIRILEADQNFLIVQALAAASTGQQTDYLARSAVYFYQSRNRVLDMLSTFVSAEVKASEHEGTLFRASSFACKLFNQYARYAGLPYLWKTLGFYVNQLAEFAKEERQDDRDDILGPGSMEVDPDRFEDEADAPNEFDIRLNQYELITRASKILKSIFASLPNMRPEFRQLCARVKSEVGAKFHDNNADYKAVGGFIFLRFLCPSIMAPHIYGLLENAPNETAQRYFVLLSKSLQNLANETLPGTNEDFMARMNEFITKNIEPLHSWVNNLCAGANLAEAVDPDLVIPENLLNSSIATMQHMLVDEWDRISRSLPDHLVSQLEPIKDKGYLGKKPAAKAASGKKHGAPPRRARD